MTGIQRRYAAERGSIRARMTPIPFHHCAFVQFFAQPSPCAASPTHSFRCKPFYGASS